MRTCSGPAGTSGKTTSTCIHRCCGSGNDKRYSTAGSAHAVLAVMVASNPINPTQPDPTRPNLTQPDPT